MSTKYEICNFKKTTYIIPSVDNSSLKKKQNIPNPL